MKETTQKLEKLLPESRAFLQNRTDEELSRRPAENKWSVKEIIGHLIDSGVNNLQRFTEIQFSEQPYQVVPYNQDKLVIVNDYQNTEVGELLDFWTTLNRQIIRVTEGLSAESLALQIVDPYEGETDLKFLIKDYVVHAEHHIRQIKDLLK